LGTTAISHDSEGAPAPVSGPADEGDDVRVGRDEEGVSGFAQPLKFHAVHPAKRVIIKPFFRTAYLLV